MEAAEPVGKGRRREKTASGGGGGRSVAASVEPARAEGLRENAEQDLIYQTISLKKARLILSCCATRSELIVSPAKARPVGILLASW